MAIQYDLLPCPGVRAKDSDEAQRLVPKVVTSSTVSFKQLAEDVCNATSFTEADVVGMMEAVATLAAHYLNNSQHVELAGLGTLSVGIACEKDAEGHQPVITSAEEVKPRQLHVSKVILNAKPEFMCRLQGPFVRAKEGFPSNAKRERMDVEARRTLLLAYLDEHPTVSIRQYGGLTGLSYRQASGELRAFADPDATDSILTTSGKGTHLVFVRRF